MTCQNGIASNPQSALPGGSWSQSCGPIAVANDIFAARCGLSGTALSYINLDYMAEGATMNNNNGVLTFSAVDTSLPLGSWCVHIFVAVQ